MFVTRDLQRLARLYATPRTMVTLRAPGAQGNDPVMDIEINVKCPACKERAGYRSEDYTDQPMIECNYCRGLFVLTSITGRWPRKRAKLAWITRIVDTKCWLWYAENSINDTAARDFWDMADKKRWVESRRLHNVIKRNAKFPIAHDDWRRFNLSILVESYNVTKPKRPYPAMLSLDHNVGALYLRYEDEKGVSLSTFYSSA